MNIYTSSYGAVIALICLLASPAEAQVRRNQAPNVKSELESYVDRYADAWAHAHRDGDPRGAEWITLAVQTLRAEHPAGKRWCLNGKRGSASDVSMDVVAYLVDESNGNNRLVEAFDVIVGAGGASPRVEWSNITNYATIGNSGTALCIAPPDLAPGPGPGPTPPNPPAPTPAPVNLAPVLEQLAALRGELAAVAADAAEAKRAARSAEHDSRELNGRPPLDLAPLMNALAPFAAGWPEYSGRVLGQGVTLRPKGQ